MKNYQIQLPDESTLKQYWGSTEAFLEEQRRTAAIDLEALQLKAGLDSETGTLIDYKSNGNLNVHKNPARLHWPFGAKSFRHA